MSSHEEFLSSTTGQAESLTSIQESLGAVPVSVEVQGLPVVDVTYGNKSSLFDQDTGGWALKDDQVPPPPTI